MGASVAQYLHETGSVRLSLDPPFRWASGWLAPVYCDNRRLLSFPLVRRSVGQALTQAARAEFAACEAIAAVATAGIPLGAILADHLGLPFCYVRSQPKAHGMGQQIEGVVHGGQAVLVIEDLISTGGSSLAAVEALQGAGAHVLGLLSVFTYGFATTRDRFSAAGIRTRSLATLDDLLLVLEGTGEWNSAQRAAIERWRQQPESWSPAAPQT